MQRWMIYDFHNKLTYVFSFFYCFPTISRASARKKMQKFRMRSVETVEIINAKCCCCRWKIAQRTCFNEKSFSLWVNTKLLGFLMTFLISKPKAHAWNPISLTTASIYLSIDAAFGCDFRLSRHLLRLKRKARRWYYRI